MSSSQRSSATPLVTPRRGPLDGLFKTETLSAGFKLIQRCLGVVELQCLYEAIKGGQREGEYFLDAILRTLQVNWDISSLDLARIPAKGGLVVVANHPYGLIEGVVIAALLRRIRPDVRVMTNSLLGLFPELAESLILVDPFGGELANRANRLGLRYALGWLKQGSVLVAFPAGEVASMQVRTMQVVDPPWSKSIARLASLARVPVLPVYFDGCNGPSFQIAGLLHPRLRTALLIREFLNKSGRSFSVRVGSLISPRRLEELHTDSDRIEYLRRKTYVLANREEPRKPIPFLVPLKALRHRTQPNEPICAPTDAVVMEQEIAALDDSACLVQQGDNSVYIGEANHLPNVIREIGRLREVTFRETGEGTGRAIDLDRFDSYYLHLFVWNHTNREIVGAYRLGQSDLILKNFGQNGLYTTTLFSYKQKFLDEIAPALEMGRAFVRLEYQKSYAPLLLLWRGIGTYVCRYPKYTTLFGPVSIRNQYHSRSRQVIVTFLKEYCRAHDLARLVRARSPFRTWPRRGWAEMDNGAVWDIEELSALVADIEIDQKGVPVLLKQYLKLGGKLVAFNVDAAFSNALDGLIVVDLVRTDRRLLERYLGKEGASEFLAYHHQPAVIAR